MIWKAFAQPIVSPSVPPRWMRSCRNRSMYVCTSPYCLAMLAMTSRPQSVLLSVGTSASPARVPREQCAEHRLAGVADLGFTRQAGIREGVDAPFVALARLLDMPIATPLAPAAIITAEAGGGDDGGGGSGRGGWESKQ